MTRRLLVALVPLFAASLACSRNTATAPGATPESAAPASATARAGDPIPPQAGVTEPMAKASVTLYFPSAAGDTLAAETREIVDTKAPADRGAQIIAALLDGPHTEGALPAVPPGTTLRHLWVRDDGSAYVDFSEELAADTNTGSWDEIQTVYAIVDSLTENIPTIRRVAILVAGQERQNFGHLDLSRPLPPDLTLAGIAKTTE